METNGITNQVRVYSQSALHSYITRPEAMTVRPRSSLNPYRRRQGLMSFFGINEVLDEVRREEHQAVQTESQTIEQPISWNLGQMSEA